MVKLPGSTAARENDILIWTLSPGSLLNVTLLNWADPPLALLWANVRRGAGAAARGFGLGALATAPEAFCVSPRPMAIKMLPPEVRIR